MFKIVVAVILLQRSKSSEIISVDLLVTKLRAV
jgi:hypothetical protein